MVKIFMLRGEVWLINLDPTIGAEIKKTRPAVVVNDDAIGLLPLKIIVPITDWKDYYAIAQWMVKIYPNVNNGLDKISSADTFQIRSLSHERFIKQLGRLSDAEMNEITNALATVLSISNVKNGDGYES